MKKKISFLFYFFIFTSVITFVNGQDINELNRIKYINVPPLVYYFENSKTGSITPMFDVYGARKIIISTLKNTGIEILQKSENENAEIRKYCQVGHCEIYHTNNLDPQIIDGIIIIITDCNYNILYQCNGKVKSMAAKRTTTSIPEGMAHIQEATREALREISNFNYLYDSIDPIEFYSTPKSQMDQKAIKNYLKSEAVNLDQIEGLFVSTDVDAYYLEVAIVRNDLNFDIIVLDSEDESWTPLDIRGGLTSNHENKYSGWLSSSKNEKLHLIIERIYNKNYLFTLTENESGEYFTIEFKKKYP